MTPGTLQERSAADVGLERRPEACLGATSGEYLDPRTHSSCPG